MGGQHKRRKRGLHNERALCGRALERFFDESEDRRIIVATFASNIHRIQQIVDLAAARGRKVCFLGRSMENVASIAMDIGEMNVPEGMLIEPERLEKVPYEEMVVITTAARESP